MQRSIVLSGRHLDELLFKETSRFSFLKCFTSSGVSVPDQKPSTGLGGRVNGFALKFERLLLSFLLLPDTPEVFGIWLELVTTHQVSGKQVHDARLAASLKAHDVETLLTLNGDDFRRFDIRVVHPREVPE